MVTWRMKEAATTAAGWLVSRSGFLASGGRGVHGPGIGGYGTALLLRSVDGGGLGHY